MSRYSGSWKETEGQAAAAGNYQTNHAYGYSSLSGMSQSKFNNEINASYNAIQLATDGQDQDRSKTLCLRPPYGSTDANSIAFSEALGYELVLWDIDPQDWRQPRASQITNHVIAYTYPGAIILVHDGGGYRDQTLEALEVVLSSLGEQGYRFEALCR